MGELTKIEWATHTLNPWIGCEKVSAECDHCYAEVGSRRLGAQHRLKLWGEGSARYFTSEAYLRQPLKWNRDAMRAGERHRVFCASFSDVFENRPELTAPRLRLQALIEQTTHLDWLLVTKRPENMVGMMAHRWPERWPPNVWAGTTCGARTSLPRLLELAKVPARVRFVSMEPLLEDLSGVHRWGLGRAIHWVIIGGESGAHARRMDLQWVRNMMLECRVSGVPIFVKQLGAHHAVSAADRKAGDWTTWPNDLRVREFPQ